MQLRTYYLSIRPFLASMFRSVINSFIVLLHVRVVTDLPEITCKTPVYVPTSRKTVYLAILSIHSFNRNIPGLKYFVLDSGDITKAQKWILQHVGICIDIICAQDVIPLRRKLKKYPSLLQYFDYGWSGRKFFVPLLMEKSDAFILLDVDILTYSEPYIIKKWLYGIKNYNLYMKDYKNFSVLSQIEMKFLLKKHLRHNHVNTGFLCINCAKIRKSLSLKQLNIFVQSIHATVSDRMITDLKTQNPIDYVYPMVEQTLYWYIFEQTKSASLPSNEYVIFPRHLMNHARLSKPVMIHFSGEADKESEYKYLWMSLLAWVKTFRNPWYSQSLRYCYSCNT